MLKFLPTNAGTSILHTVHEKNSLGPWTGLGVLALYSLAALVIGGVLLVRRDA